MRRVSKGFAALVVLLICLGFPLPASASVEAEVISAVNGARSGMSALAQRGDLDLVAQRHARRMAAEGRLFHNSNLANDVSGWTLVGENVGMGGDVATIHDLWMGSSAHRANILDTRYSEIGVGVVATGDRFWIVQVFRAPTAVAGPVAAPAAAPVRAPRPVAPKPAAAPAPVPAPAPAPVARPVPVPAIEIDHAALVTDEMDLAFSTAASTWARPPRSELANEGSAHDVAAASSTPAAPAVTAIAVLLLAVVTGKLGSHLRISRPQWVRVLVTP